MLQLAQPATSQQWQEYFDLRWRILRAPWNQPRGAERDEFDEAAQTVDHVTACDDSGRLVGIGRLHLNNPGEVQIRYMAVEPDCRGLGVGRAIVGELERLAIARAAARIVLNAREDVVGFYERLGYSVVAPGPTMFDTVKHVEMEKRLSGQSGS